MRPSLPPPLLVATVVLTACGGGEPTALAPSAVAGSASPSASPSPTLSPSPSPSLTEEQAVEAAVRFYYDGFARAVASGDAKELEKGSTEQCRCREVIPSVATVLERGEVTGGNVVIDELSVDEVGPQIATVNVDMNGMAAEVRGPDGTVIETIAGEGPVRKALLLRKTLSGWLVDAVMLLNG